MLSLATRDGLGGMGLLDTVLALDVAAGRGPLIAVAEGEVRSAA